MNCPVPRAVQWPDEEFLIKLSRKQSGENQKDDGQSNVDGAMEAASSRRVALQLQPQALLLLPARTPFAPLAPWESFDLWGIPWPWASSVFLVSGDCGIQWKTLQPNRRLPVSSSSPYPRFIRILPVDRVGIWGCSFLMDFAGGFRRALTRSKFIPIPAVARFFPLFACLLPR